MYGYLSLRKGFSNWESYYVDLNEELGVLVYSITPTSEKEGTIVLGGFCSVDERKPTRFSVMTSKRKAFVFQADSAVESSEWVKAISEAQCSRGASLRPTQSRVCFCPYVSVRTYPIAPRVAGSSNSRASQDPTRVKVLAIALRLRFGLTCGDNDEEGEDFNGSATDVAAQKLMSSLNRIRVRAEREAAAQAADLSGVTNTAEFLFDSIEPMNFATKAERLHCTSANFLQNHQQPQQQVHTTYPQPGYNAFSQVPPSSSYPLPGKHEDSFSLGYLPQSRSSSISSVGSTCSDTVVVKGTLRGWEPAPFPTIPSETSMMCF